MPLEPYYRSVRVIDHVKTGEKMRDIRLASKVGLRAVARRVGLSATMLCDLEKGRRSWTSDRFQTVLAAVEELEKVGIAARQEATFTPGPSVPTAPLDCNSNELSVGEHTGGSGGTPKESCIHTGSR